MDPTDSVLGLGGSKGGWVTEGRKGLSDGACGEGAEETVMNGGSSVDIDYPGFQSGKGCKPRVSAGGVWEGEEMGLIFADKLTAGAAAVVPLTAMLHHIPECSKATDVF
jgi:hypothetical protein